MIDDGTFTYTWDMENRLVSIIPASPATDDKKVEYAYDYMGRRVRKIVSTYDGSTWSEDSDEIFIYDQWNVIMVLDANDANYAVERKYTWGLDLSGQSGNFTAAGIHGAGGVGGLLAVEETATGGTPAYWYLYDANGNVGQVVNNATGYTVAAHYEYDPYGNVILAHDADSSGYVDTNPIRFSTKWFDAESGLGYWGYRYYSPGLGRWMSRDPLNDVVRLGISFGVATERLQHGFTLQEVEINLYMYVNNSPVLFHDKLGLYGSTGLGSDCNPHALRWRRDVLEDPCSLGQILDRMLQCGPALVGSFRCAGVCLVCAVSKGMNAQACNQCSLCSGVSFDCIIDAVVNCGK